MVWGFNNYLFSYALFFAVHFFRCSNCLSVCDPVDSIFIFNAKVVQNEKLQENKLAKFLQELVFEASSELSGIGVIAFGAVPLSLQDDYTLLTLKDTIAANTKLTKAIIKKRLDFSEFDEDEFAEVALEDAIATAHQLFIDEGWRFQKEALFIVDVEGSEETANELEACASAAASNQTIESIFFVQVADETNRLEVVSIYDCLLHEEVVHYDELVDLYDITCPTLLDLPDGELKLNKRVQYIELGSVISCDLVTTDSDCKLKYELSPESTITVWDDLNDEMSYEEGYILMATETIFDLLPKECTVPLMKIEHIEEIYRETDASSNGNDELERILQINVTIPEMWEYIMEADLGESTNDVPYVKPDEDLVDQSLIQQARNQELSKKRNRKRRLFLGGFVDAIGGAVSDGVDAVGDVANDVGGAVVDAAEVTGDALVDVGEAVLSVAGDLLEAGADLILDCLPSFDFPSLPYFDLITLPNGFEITIPISLVDEEYSASSAAGNSKMTVTGTGVVSVNVDLEIYFSLFVRVYGPSFDWSASFPPVELTDLGVELYGTFRFTATAEAYGSGDIEFEGEVLSKYLKRTPFIHWIGPVPIVHWPKIVIGMEGSWNSILETSVNYEYIYQGDYSIGARYRPSTGVQLIRSYTGSSTTNYDSATDALSAALPSCPQTMPFELGLPIKLGDEFYLALFPYIQFKPALEGAIIIGYSGCRSSGCDGVIPTGAALDANLVAYIDVGIEGSNIGWSISCIFDLPNGESFTLWSGTLYDFPTWSGCLAENEVLANIQEISWSPSGTVGLCEGDCDNDDDCDIGLVCYQRSGAAGLVPGCNGNPSDEWDFCVFPDVDEISWSPSVTLGPCQGDCDSDDDCDIGLVCYQRSGAAGLVPGCNGNPSDEWDFCVLPTIQEISWTPSGTLSLCQGDCDSDNDCDIGLVCYHRSGAAGLVPGCNGVPNDEWDFCAIPTIQEISWTPSVTLGPCQGDCDSDAECDTGLYCYQRNGAAGLVPGCNGKPNDDWDFCVAAANNTVFLELPVSAVFGIGLLVLANLLMLTFSVWRRCRGDTKNYLKLKVYESESESD